MTSGQRQIRFASTSDGLSIAYAALGSGEGIPIVIPPGWISHIELEWQASTSGDFLDAVAERRPVIFYDGRGTGLSDRRDSDLTLEGRLKDLEAVVEHAGLDKFVLFAWSQATPVAIAYAGRHLERIDRLILYAAFARGAGEGEGAVIRALINLIRAEWGAGARTTTGFIHPDASREEVEASLAFFRAASTGEVAARILEEGFFNTDVREYLPRITVPALVLHRRLDNAVSLDAGREIASLLPNARFVVLEGDHHPPFHGDTDAILRAVDEFLGLEARPPAAASPTPSRGSPPVTILFTDMEGSTSLTQRLGDSKAQERVHTHNRVVRASLASHGGDEIKHTGDGIMASFPSASGALECAISIQRALARHNHEQPDAPVNVRIGLNAGEPVREQEDLFGHAVQLARRVCDRAAPGQILASNVVRELVAGKGFLFADQGEIDLRGFEDPVRLYAVHWAE